MPRPRSITGRFRARAQHVGAFRFVCPACGFTSYAQLNPHVTRVRCKHTPCRRQWGFMTALFAIPSGKLPPEFAEWLRIPEHVFPDAIAEDGAESIEAFPAAAVVDVELIAAAIRKRFGRPEYLIGEGEGPGELPHWGPPEGPEGAPEGEGEEPGPEGTAPAQNAPLSVEKAKGGG